MRKGQRCLIRNKENENNKMIEIISRAGKATSKKWKNSYNVKDIETGNIEWINMEEYKDFEEIDDREEIMLINEEKEDIMKAKMNEIESWKKNEVYEEIDNQKQKTVNTK